MAQYVPYIPEVLPETPLFTPDMNFFDRMMQRKQAMFEQGLSRARTAYNSVLTAPLSSKENIPLRDQYVKDAQESLKALASADLSLPQNVAAAENVFSPFWQDKYIMKDMELTKSYQTGFQTLDGWKNSTDPKTRELYSGITEKYLMNGYEKLQNAQRNDESFASVERRKPVAFANIQAYLEDQAAKSPDKLQIVWDQQSPDGAYLISTTNGERAKQSFATWAASQIGNNFYQQFNVTGIVEREEREKILKRANPGMSDADIKKKIAESAIGELEEGYDKRKTTLDTELARINGIIKAMPATLTPQQERQLDVFEEQIAEIKGRQAALNVEYSKFNQGKDAKLKGVMENPDAYFATLAKQRVIDGWATGRASVSGNKITTNDAYFKAQEFQLKIKEYERNLAKDAWDMKVDQWNMANGNLTGKNSKVKTQKEKDEEEKKDPTLSEGYDPVSRGFLVGLGDKDITKTGSAYDNYTQKMSEMFTDAHNKIFNSRGVLTTLKSLGVTDEDIVNVSSALLKDVNALNNGTAYAYNNEEAKASNKITNLLLQSPAVKAAGIDKITGPYSFRTALMAYAGEYMKERNKLYKDGTLLPSDEEEQAMVAYTTAIQELELYNANEQRRQDLIKKNISSDPKTYGKVTVERNGKKDLITVDDLAKDMPSLTLLSTADGTTLNLTKDQVAAAFARGELNGTQMGDFSYGGKNYTIQKVDGKTSSTLFGMIDNSAALWNSIYNDKIVPKYGESKEFSKLLKQANTSVVPDLLYYSSQTGKMGVEFAHAFDKKRPMVEDKNARIFTAALNTSNAEFYDENGEVLSAETIKKLQALLADEARIETYVGQFKYLSQGIKGRPTIRFSISDQPTESGKTGVNLDDLKTQTFNLAILPTATSPDLKDLPTNTGVYVYDKLLRGQKVDLDPIISASGFSGTLLPLNNTNPDQVKVSLKYDVRVNSRQPDGQIVTKMEPREVSEVFNLKGPNAKNPDELMAYVYSLYISNLRENKRLRDEFENTLKNNPGVPTITKEQALKQRNITVQ